MPEDSYSYGMIKKGYKLARKYLGADDEPAETPAKPEIKPGKTRAQIAAEEASMNKGTENLTQTQPKTGTPTGRDAAEETAVKPKPAATAAPAYQRSRSILQGVKDKALDKATTTTDPETGEKKRKGFGLATAGRSFLGGR